ncbi:Glucose-6-phosphate isomerase [Seminavis robusta]|uniref:Glucose-6-phosphate isomerase n=1 Tax=Seminavis robusta TaxID=568900 RepID=A0A9N8H4Q2_9STRA|nr:Glucose-6-phosphate isomerase [Seminavis robusta]|eukprot:Sro120_g058570.1 Glucose-6-phosphate isomerase (659) ;mRNA; r:74073-76224
MNLSPWAVGYFVFVSSLSSSVTANNGNSSNNKGFISRPAFLPKEHTKDIPKTGDFDRMSYAQWTLKCTDVPQFDALEAAAASFRTDDKLHLRNLCNDSARCAGLTAVHMNEGGRRRLHLDYSRQQVTGEVMELLYDLADAVNFHDRREAMRRGALINSTEERAVMHHVLRMPRGYDFSIYGTPINGSSAHYGRAAGRGFQKSEGNVLLQNVHRVQEKIERFSNKVRSGEIRGVTGKRLKNFVCIGIGGSQLGAEFVHEAFRADPRAAKAAQGRTLRFLANVDPVDFYLTTKDLDPAETLIIVASKTFSTAETMLNARTVRKWLDDSLASISIKQADITAKHMIAVSSNPDLCKKFGILEQNVFGFWDWVGGRFSVCSAVGLVPLSLQFSFEVMEEFLAGAHDIDEHFFNAPPRDNIPVILGLLGVWNSTFLGYGTRALLPYAQALRRFPAHIQQVDMESNGKSVALDGTPLLHESGEILFGEPGTNGQHSFYQCLHQGRVVPADFIGFMESQQPFALEKEVANHDELMSNFFAQPDALAYGKTLVDLIQEGVPAPLRQHMVFAGNRPSSSILMTKLDVFAVGQLLALYEHRTAVQGFIWGINSFDQFGVELGKVMAKNVRTQITAARLRGVSVQGFNGSTTSLLELYLNHGKMMEHEE